MGHPVSSAEHTVLRWVSRAIQQRPSSSCSGVLSSEQAQPAPTTLQQGVAREPAAAATAEANAEANAESTAAVFTGQLFVVGCME